MLKCSPLLSKRTYPESTLNLKNMQPNMFYTYIVQFLEPFGHLRQFLASGIATMERHDQCRTYPLLQQLFNGRLRFSGGGACPLESSFQRTSLSSPGPSIEMPTATLYL